MVETAEPVEAVIISGPRRGEIVRLPDGGPAVLEQEMEALNAGLDLVLAAVERLAKEVHETAEAFRDRAEPR